MNIYFDIETEPLSEKEIVNIIGDFDESSVRLGNIIDPDKARAKKQRAKKEWREKAIKNAALSPMTGSVCAIGWLITTDDGGRDRGILTSLDCSEREQIVSFWKVVIDNCESAAYAGFATKLIGWNIKAFDVPFLIKRSWFLGIKPPALLMHENDGRLSQRVVDLMLLWSCGNWAEKNEKLDTVAKFLGLKEKPFNGADFSDILKQDKQLAIDYLVNDVELLEQIHATTRMD